MSAQPIRGALADKLRPMLRTHFAGFVLHRIASVINGGYQVREGDPGTITIDQHQSNGGFGIHQMRVRLSGDPTVYRLILAPADAPLKVSTCPIRDHFIEPIGDA